MSDDMHSVLSTEEWSARSAQRSFSESVSINRDGTLAIDIGDWRAENLPALIALANAALPDDAPHKITWQMVDRLRIAEGHRKTCPRYMMLSDYEGDSSVPPCDCLAVENANHVADILASLLPPRVDVA